MFGATHEMSTASCSPLDQELCHDFARLSSRSSAGLLGLRSDSVVLDNKSDCLITMAPKKAPPKALPPRLAVEPTFRAFHFWNRIASEAVMNLSRNAMRRQAIAFRLHRYAIRAAWREFVICAIVISESTGGDPDGGPEGPPPTDLNAMD